MQDHVGQWGDASTFTTATQYAEKWRQVLFNNPDACDIMELVTGRQIDILYEKTGSVLNPQKKVLLLVKLILNFIIWSWRCSRVKIGK